MDQLEVDDFLVHYGVKGMKWGVRKSDGYISRTKARYVKNKNRVAVPTFEVETKFGEKVAVTQRKDEALINFIAALSNKTTENLSNDFGFDFSVDGRKVGEAAMMKRSKDELYLNWLGVDPQQRGKGYGSAVFDAAVKHAQNEGVKKITLEVPGNAPDARHIYEKQGFKATKELTKKEMARDRVWGGLIPMELDVTKKSLKHFDTDEESNELEEAFARTFTSLPPDVEAKVFPQTPSTSAEDFLAHYGVKGMKWGVRKDRTKSASDSQSQVKQTDSEAKAARRAKAKKVAIGTGLLLVAAGTAYAGYKLNQSGNLPVSSLGKAKPEVKKKVESIMTEPSDLVYSTRMRQAGFSFHRRGNLPDPIHEYDRAFGDNTQGVGFFKRYGNDNEKVAVTFIDPDGRRDQAGRLIPHEVIIPKSMSAGISTHAEAVKVAWDAVGKTYSDKYDNEVDRYTGEKFPEWRK